MKGLDKNIKRKYVISDYDPRWVDQFNHIKQFLIKVFGNKAFQIEHVGSTSVPGMKAKPVIDVLVVVEKIENFTEEKEKMTEAGYDWGENYIAPNTLIFFKAGEENQKFENIHVCEKNAPKNRQFLVMRDFLRAYPDKAKQYSDLKKEISNKYPNDYPAYRAEKAPFLEQIKKEAYQWEKGGK